MLEPKNQIFAPNDPFESKSRAIFIQFLNSVRLSKWRRIQSRENVSFKSIIFDFVESSRKQFFTKIRNALNF